MTEKRTETETPGSDGESPDGERSVGQEGGCEGPETSGARLELAQKRKLHRARRAVATIPPTRTRGVLVVEDDPDLQWKLARMLTVRGNRVVGTSSAEAALELIRQWPVDLVLVAEGLPGMSGTELARIIQEDHPDTPVVLMTTEHSVAPLGDALAGVVAVVTKPFRIESLVELLRSFPKGDTDLTDLVPAE